MHLQSGLCVRLANLLVIYASYAHLILISSSTVSSRQLLLAPFLAPYSVPCKRAIEYSMLVGHRRSGAGARTRLYLPLISMVASPDVYAAAARKDSLSRMA